MEIAPTFSMFIGRAWTHEKQEWFSTRKATHYDPSEEPYSLQ